MSVCGALYEVAPFFQHVFVERPVPPRVVELIVCDERAVCLDLDKAWAALDYLLKKVAPDSYDCLVIRGEEPLGSVGGYELGYIRSDTVKMIADGLTGRSPDERVAELESAYVVEELVDGAVYPVELWARDRREAFDFLAQHYRRLIDWVPRVAARDGAILCAIR